MSVIIWLALLFEGKAPRSLQGFVVSYLRYSVHVSAYLYLAAGPYPPFGGGEGYPDRLEIEPSARQSRRPASRPGSCSRSRCSCSLRPSAVARGS